jgi:hypothetical protein
MIIGSFMGEFFKLIQATTLNPGDTETIQSYFTSVGFWLQLVLMMIFFGVSSVMTIATINNYIVLYGEKQTNQIEVSEVWERVRSSFMMYFTTMFFFFLMAIAMYILLIIPVVLLAAVSPGLIVIGMMLMFVVFFYLTISVSLTFIVRTYERKGFLDSIGRSFKLVQGKWWSTFGLIVVLYLIMMVISYIPMMPWYIMTVISTLHNTSSDTLQTPTPMGEMTTIIFFVLYYMIQMVLATLPNIGIAFQYFNLVELKEAKGLVNKIDTLGETPASTHESEEQY